MNNSLDNRPSCVAARWVSARIASRSNVILSALLVLATSVALAPAARADSYNFSFSGGSMSGSGVLTYSNTAVPGVPGAYQVTGISGTFSDSNLGLSNAAITGLQTTGLPTNITPAGQPFAGSFVPPGSQAAGFGFSYDNLFYPAGNSPAVCPPPLPGDPNGPYPFGGGLLDIYGLLFNVNGGANGVYNVGLWSNGFVPPLGGLTYGVGDAQNGTVLNVVGEPFNDAESYATMSASPVPEPSSLILLGTGFLGLVGTLRRKLAA